MRTFQQMKAETLRILGDAGMGDVTVHPGPDLPDIPNRYVVWTRYGGPGMDADGALDELSWQARCVGKQNNYDSAEEVADAIDIAFMSHYSRKVNGVWVSQIRRVGGAPNSLLLDDADRTHFVCSYIVSVELALAN